MQTTPFGPYGLSISILLVGMMLALSGMALGLGYALNDKGLKEFGKKEIMQSLINGALVGGFLVLFVNGGLVDSLINSMVLANGTTISCSSFLQYNSAICFAYNYLVGTNQYYFMGFSRYSVLTSVMTLMIALTTLYATLGLLKLFLSPLLSQIQGIVQILGAAAVSATTQAAVLSFIAASALTVMLPLGLVLRAFYPTRSLGSFLIALTIGLYIVLPLTYLMNATIVGYYGSANSQASLTTLIGNVTRVSSSATGYANQYTSSGGVLEMVVGAWNELMEGVSTLLSSFFNIVAYFILYAFLLPAFSLMLTGISVRELARLLGSESFFGKYNLL